MLESIKAQQVINNNALLDLVIETMGLRSDAALGRLLDVAPPVISKVRHGVLPIGQGMLIRCHERAGLSFPAMRVYVPECARRVHV